MGVHDDELPDTDKLEAHAALNALPDQYMPLSTKPLGS